MRFGLPLGWPIFLATFFSTVRASPGKGPVCVFFKVELLRPRCSVFFKSLSLCLSGATLQMTSKKSFSQGLGNVNKTIGSARQIQMTLRLTF
jgi:hypothetical protein